MCKSNTCRSKNLYKMFHIRNSYHKFSNFRHKNMKLLILFLAISALQCVYSLKVSFAKIKWQKKLKNFLFQALDSFKANLKSGKTQFKCSFRFEVKDSEVTSTKIQCKPKNKAAKFNNLELKGNLGKYLISFRVNPTKVLKVSTGTENNPTDVMTPYLTRYCSAQLPSWVHPSVHH